MRMDKTLKIGRGRKISPHDLSRYAAIYASRAGASIEIVCFNL